MRNSDRIHHLHRARFGGWIATALTLGLLASLMALVSTATTSSASATTQSVYSVRVHRHRSATLVLRDGSSLFIPRGALPAGTRVFAHYGRIHSADRKRVPVAVPVHFSLKPFSRFRKPLLLRTPAPSYLKAATRFGYYDVGFYNATKRRWILAPSRYNPRSGMITTVMHHFSVWDDVKDAAEKAKIVAECAVKAVARKSWQVFLQCLVDEGFKSVLTAEAQKILQSLLPPSCWADLVTTAASLDPGAILIASQTSPHCVGKAGDDRLQPPVITGISPSSGSTGGGNTVTITGRYFSTAQRVAFGGTAASFEIAMNSDTEITAHVPAHSAGTVNVTVTDGAGTSASSSATQYTYRSTTTTSGGGGGGSGSPQPSAGASLGLAWSSAHPGWVVLSMSGFPTGSYTYTCGFGSGGDQSYTLTETAQPQTFDTGKTCYDKIAGDTVWITIDGIRSNTLTVGQAPAPPPPSGTTYAETTGSVTHTWTNYSNAGGVQGPSISSNQTVQIACKVTGFQVADGNTWWYEVASSPWSGTYFASADAFYNNGQTSGSLKGTPFVDSAVPTCGTSAPPPPPATYAETTGSVAHTWTNYTNAGGTQGPNIASNQTVQITCRLTGFQVADGNTWWYRIASSPWNNQYYVSADAFYNNGQTSGSLSGTPWVDTKVPTC